MKSLRLHLPPLHVKIRLPHLTRPLSPGPLYHPPTPGFTGSSLNTDFPRLCPCLVPCHSKRRAASWSYQGRKLGQFPGFRLLQNHKVGGRGSVWWWGLLL